MKAKPQGLFFQHILPIRTHWSLSGPKPGPTKPLTLKSSSPKTENDMFTHELNLFPGDCNFDVREKNLECRLTVLRAGAAGQ